MLSWELLNPSFQKEHLEHGNWGREGSRGRVCGQRVLHRSVAPHQRGVRSVTEDVAVTSERPPGSVSPLAF